MKRSVSHTMRNWAYRLCIAIALALPSLGAVAQPAQDCGTPASVSDGWKVERPEAAGLKPEILCGIGPRFTAWREADVHSVLVVRHGALVYRC